jgi:hypothetical protein
MPSNEYDPANSVGLGDIVHKALSVVGITPERVSQWIGAPCGCEERRKKWNSLSAWAGRVLSGRVDKAREYLDRITED